MTFTLLVQYNVFRCRASRCHLVDAFMLAHLKLSHNPARERSNTRLQGCAICPLSSSKPSSSNAAASCLCDCFFTLISSLPVLLTFIPYIWWLEPPGADGTGRAVVIRKCLNWFLAIYPALPLSCHTSFNFVHLFFPPCSLCVSQAVFPSCPAL